ncbi:MAG: ABC transporter permease, partial [Rhodoferax sp.]|nr:ABC transporter permease [Rhodoferax sp.]
MNATKRHIPWGALGPWIALAVTCLFFTIQTERFLSGTNLSLVLQQVMVVGVLAIG